MNFSRNKILIQTFFFINFTIFICCFPFFYMLVLTGDMLMIFIVFCLFVYSLHNLMNLLHISSHNLVSRNKLINNTIGHICAIFSGLTFIEFRSTHILHHKHTKIYGKDPDMEITNSGHYMLIPFRIWQKDVYFFKSNLYKKKGYLISYLLDRILQLFFIILIICAILTFKIYVFGIILSLYLLALFITGFLNGLFLFFFPHYSTPFVDKTNLKFVKNAVQLSRISHSQHHDRISRLDCYFPLERY